MNNKELTLEQVCQLVSDLGQRMKEVASEDNCLNLPCKFSYGTNKHGVFYLTIQSNNE